MALKLYDNYKIYFLNKIQNLPSQVATKTRESKQGRKKNGKETLGEWAEQ